MADKTPNIYAIFNEAAERESDAERREYLDEACQGDPQVRGRVEALLRAHSHPKNGLGSALPAIAPTIDQSATIAEQIGTYIGPYKLNDEIGEGGMGVVYRAVQKEPIRRKVALKVIKAGMDSKQVVQRFDAERHTLALMDHPNIARVIDGGTTESGRPYFVMELVRGIPITDYCDRHQLTTNQRLEVFQDVCSAVQHAHQKGIIHRDLKPSNVLVTQLDGKAIPKVIDFGIAKATSGHLTDGSLVTAHAQLVGTPMYMSPEQADTSAADVDTRSDVYSLGVLLYELLVGTTPFDRERMSSVSFDEFRRIVQEEDPPRPSTRLSTLNLALDTVAEKHHTDPRTLSSEIRGELDWIVMKALEKDRTRRYESANELAKDVRRYLDDEAVEACPPSKVYRLKKFTRRNKTAVLATAAVGLALILGAGVAAGQAYRATKAERLANEQLEIAKEQRRLAKQQEQLAKKQKKLAEEATSRERDLRTEAEQQRDLAEKATQQADAARKQAETVTDFLVETFRSPDPKRDGRTVTVAEILDRTVKDLEDKFADQPLLKAQILHALGETYWGLGLYGNAEKLHKQSLEIRQRVLGRTHSDTLNSMNNLAVAYRSAGRTQEAIQLLEETLRIVRETFGAEHPNTLNTMNELACAYLDAGRTPEAIQLFEQTLRLKREHLGAEQPETLVSMNDLALAYRIARRTQEAIPLLEEMIPLMGEKRGAEHPDTLMSMNNLACAYLDAGRTPDAIQLFEEALRLRREKLGAEHPDTLTSMNDLAGAYNAAGRTPDAIKLLEETLRLNREHLGAEHPNTLASMNNLAGVYSAAGRNPEAIQLFEETLRIVREQLGAEHPNTLTTMSSLAGVYNAVGRIQEAIQLLKETLRIQREHLGAEHPSTLTSMNRLAVAYLAASRTREAIPLLEESLRLLRKHLGAEHPETLTSMNNLANAFWRADRTPEAIQLFEEALRLRREKLGAEHPATLGSMKNLAYVYAAAGRYEEAEQLHQEELAMRRKKHPNSTAVAGALASLARTLLNQQKFAEAEPHARESLQICQKNIPAELLTHDAQSLLGRSLAGQKKYEEAEPLLLGGYQGMKQREDKIPAAGKIRLTEALDGLIQLYDDWGKPEEAQKWRQTREQSPVADKAAAERENTEAPNTEKAQDDGEN